MCGHGSWWWTAYWSARTFFAPSSAIVRAWATVFSSSRRCSRLSVDILFGSLLDLHGAVLQGLDQLLSLAVQPSVDVCFGLEHGTVKGYELNFGLDELCRLL